MRCSMAFIAVCRSGLNLKEQIFVSLAWIPKATVQVNDDLSSCMIFCILKEIRWSLCVYEGMLCTKQISVDLSSFPIGCNRWARVRPSHKRRERRIKISGTDCVDYSSAVDHCHRSYRGSSYCYFRT